MKSGSADPRLSEERREKGKKDKETGRGEDKKMPPSFKGAKKAPSRPGRVKG